VQLQDPVPTPDAPEGHAVDIDQQNPADATQQLQDPVPTPYAPEDRAVDIYQQIPTDATQQFEDSMHTCNGDDVVYLGQPAYIPSGLEENAAFSRQLELSDNALNLLRLIKSPKTESDAANVSPREPADARTASVHEEGVTDVRPREPVTAHTPGPEANAADASPLQPSDDGVSGDCMACDSEWVLVDDDEEGECECCGFDPRDYKPVGPQMLKWQ
jgi:hypothetical protein